MTIAKSTVMRTEVDGCTLDGRADRSIDHDGKTRLGIQLHLLRNGGVNVGGASGTLHARSFEEMTELLKLFTTALEQLRSADQK